MQDFQATDNTLAKWTIDKSGHLMIASLIFIVPLAIFLVSFVYVYIILKSTNIVLLVVPVLLFFPTIPAFIEFWQDLQIFKNKMEVYLTEKGVYVRHLDKGDEHDFIAWYDIKQYDVTTFPSSSIFGSFIRKPSRFTLRGSAKGDGIIVDAIGNDELILRDQLKTHNISFGFMND